jgi:predicted enzyme related to lactoylglutathione lyase
VAETVATASAAGAKVMLQPTRVGEIPIAILVDPTGAPFGVAEWAGTAREVR